MKICFLVHDIHFGGGGERVVTNLANEFVLRNYEVTIISLCKRNQREYLFDINKVVKIKYLDSDIFNNSAINKLISLFKLNSFFKENSFDFVLGIGTYINILLAIINDKNNYKTIGCEHSSFNNASYLWKFLRKKLYYKLSVVVSLTEYDKKNLQKINKNVVVIPNSCSFTIKEKSKLENYKIVSLGRFSYEKGYDLMIEMFSEFCKLNKSFNLEIYGDGGEKHNIKKLIKKYNLEQRISIFSTNKNVIPIYLNSSIYLMTSRFEGLPMVLIEALECGLPLIAYNCKTGPAELIKDGENGFLIPCFDKILMAQKLNELCNNFELRKTMGKNSKKMSEQFQSKNIIKKWEDLFNNLGNL